MSTSHEVYQQTENPLASHAQAKNGLERLARERRIVKIEERHRRHRSNGHSNGVEPDAALQFEAVRLEFRARVTRALEGNPTLADRAFIREILPKLEQPSEYPEITFVDLG